MFKVITNSAIIAVMLMSCSTNKNDDSATAPDKFTWSVQLAGYEHDRADQKGETDYANFIREFETFPWLEQLERYQQIQQGSSPTMTVKDLKTGKDFWVLMSGDRDAHGYLIGYTYPKEKKVEGIDSRKAESTRWLEVYLTSDPVSVKECFKRFFDRDYDKLEAKIKRLDPFGEMEAEDFTF